MLGWQEIHLTNRVDEWFALKRNCAEMSKYNRDNSVYSPLVTPYECVNFRNAQHLFRSRSTLANQNPHVVQSRDIGKRNPVVLLQTTKTEAFENIDTRSACANDVSRVSTSDQLNWHHLYSCSACGRKSSFQRYPYQSD